MSSGIRSTRYNKKNLEFLEEHSTRTDVFHLVSSTQVNTNIEFDDLIEN